MPAKPNPRIPGFSLLNQTGFNYCPRCASQPLQQNDAKSLCCPACGFIFYHSPVAAVVGIVEWQDQIILTRRAFEPHKGRLALPGGFVDYAESLEDALLRELGEELNLEVSAPLYLCSHWDEYRYQDVLYHTSVAYFVVQAGDIERLQANDDVAACFWVRPDAIDQAELAFEADRVALARYTSRSPAST